MIIHVGDKFIVNVKRRGVEEPIQTMECHKEFDSDTQCAMFMLMRNVLLKIHGWELHEFTHKSTPSSYCKWIIHYGYALNIPDKFETIPLSICIDDDYNNDEVKEKDTEEKPWSIDVEKLRKIYNALKGSP